LFKDIEILQPTFVEPVWETGIPFIQYIVHCVKTKWEGSNNVPSGPFTRPLCLVADTIVVLKNEVLGKPESDVEARVTLRKLSGKEHQVYTGFILDREGAVSPEVVTVETKVRFRKLTTQEIAAYVKSGEARDKAGSYGFQGGALAFIESVDGSYSNVLGLPLLDIVARAEVMKLKRLPE